jgi:hypothetical protein
MEERFTQYLGDGVYVSWDGYHIVIRANSHIDPNPIYFDGEVLQIFLKYVEELKNKINKQVENEPRE